MVSKNLSVCLSVTNCEPNYLRTGRTEWAKKIHIYVIFYAGILAGSIDFVSIWFNNHNVSSEIDTIFKIKIKTLKYCRKSCNLA